MREHLSEQDLESYRRRTMSPSYLLSADDHLARCEDCYSRVAEPSQAGTILAALGAGPRSLSGDDHLAYEQLAAYADGELDEVGREIADVHLEVCGQCAEELRGFIDLRDEPIPASYPQAPGAAPRTAGRSSGRWRLFFGWRPVRVAWAALALLMVGGLLWVLWSRQTSGPPREVVDSARPAAGDVTPAPNAVTPRADVEGRPADVAERGASQDPAPRPASPDGAPRVVAALNDGGGQVVLDERGDLTGLAGLPPEQRRAVETVLSSQRVPASPALERLSGRAGALMGAAGEGTSFALLEPVGVIVRADRPTLRWQPLGGADAYIAEIYDMGYNKVTGSPRLSTTEWTVPEALRRGEVYVWQVTAVKEGREIRSPVRPAPDAKFKVLEKGAADELARAARLHPNSHLLLGTLYARAGLLEDAEREFQLLLTANPKSALARKLLRDVRAKRAGR